MRGVAELDHAAVGGEPVGFRVAEHEAPVVDVFLWGGVDEGGDVGMPGVVGDVG